MTDLVRGLKATSVGGEGAASERRWGSNIEPMTAGDMREATRRVLTQHPLPEVIHIPRDTWEKFRRFVGRERRRSIRQRARDRKQRRGWR